MLLLRLTGWAAGKAGSRAAWLDSTVDSVPTCSTVFYQPAWNNILATHHSFGHKDEALGRFLSRVENLE